MSVARGAVSQSLCKFQLAELSSLKNDIVSVPADASVSTALEEMRFKGLTALPVRHASQAGEYLGIVNLVDVATFVAFGLFPHGQDPATVKMDDALPKLVQTPVADLIGVTDEGKRVWSFKDTDPLGSVLDPLSKGVHRALVVSDSSATKVVSQTDVLNLFEKHRDMTDAAALGKKLNESGMLRPAQEGKVVTVPSTETTLTGYRRMTQSQLSALAVVNDAGAVVGTLSASDLRGVLADQIPAKVQLALSEFLPKTHPVTATPTTQVGEVMTQMLTAKVHHVWIVDSAQKPLYCVSISDLIEYLITFSS